MILIFTVFKPILAIGLWLSFIIPALSQHPIDQTKGLNALELGQNISILQDQLQMITGKETVYQNNPWLAESVKKNLKNGIKEGIYLGQPRKVLNGNIASGQRVLFYNEEVYKIRWTFERSDFPNLQTVLNDFNDYFIKRFGQPTETMFEDTFIWKGKKHRLQVFSDGKSVQVEWRDEEVEKTILSLYPS